MLGKYYYHEVIRKTIIAFGTVFNNVHIKHNDSAGVESDLKVAIAYGPVQKFLARLEQQPKLNKTVGLTLPRMSFEMTGISYDPVRKASVTQTFRTNTGAKITESKKVFMPVPYNVSFQLSIATKTNDDMLQIMEQILPYFQPALNITINLVDSIGEKRDIPIVIETINMSDDYEGSFDTRRAMITTITFTAKTYLFGAIADTPEGLIKKVQVDYSAGIRAPREVRYTVTPAATKDYNDDETTNITATLEKGKTLMKVASSASLQLRTFIQVNDEVMRIEGINNRDIIVARAQYGTTEAEHYSGDKVNIINTADDNLIQPMDDFGFNEDIEFFTDFKTYSPSQGIDV